MLPLRRSERKGSQAGCCLGCRGARRSSSAPAKRDYRPLRKQLCITHQTQPRGSILRPRDGPARGNVPGEFPINKPIPALTRPAGHEIMRVRAHEARDSTVKRASGVSSTPAPATGGVPVTTVSVLEVLADKAEAELRRVAAARPFLAVRCERAESILAVHLGMPQAGFIRARVRGGELVGYLVRGSSGEVYRVEASGRWRCSCPDHHRRSQACKHGLAAWALWRASARPAPVLEGELAAPAAPEIRAAGDQEGAPARSFRCEVRSVRSSRAGRRRASGSGPRGPRGVGRAAGGGLMAAPDGLRRGARKQGLPTPPPWAERAVGARSAPEGRSARGRARPVWRPLARRTAGATL